MFLLPSSLQLDRVLLPLGRKRAGPSAAFPRRCVGGAGGGARLQQQLHGGRLGSAQTVHQRTQQQPLGDRDRCVRACVRARACGWICTTVGFHELCNFTCSRVVSDLSVVLLLS